MGGGFAFVVEHYLILNEYPFEREGEMIRMVVVYQGFEFSIVSNSTLVFAVLLLVYPVGTLGYH